MGRYTPPGRYTLLRKHCATLLEQETLNETLRACLEKKIFSTKDAEYILSRMSLRKLLRTRVQEKENVWKVYASRQAVRFREHLLLQGRSRYMNYLYTGTSKPFPVVKKKSGTKSDTKSDTKTRGTTSEDIISKDTADNNWTVLSKDDIVPQATVKKTKKKSAKESETRDPSKDLNEDLNEDVTESVCYTCTKSVKKQEEWEVAHLVYPGAGEELCNEKYNLRIVCNACHAGLKNTPVHAYVMGDGVYKCGKSLAAKEFITTLGQAMTSYYGLYRGRYHSE